MLNLIDPCSMHLTSSCQKMVDLVYQRLSAALVPRGAV